MDESMLYYGDNLQILKEYIKNDSVDLIYLDPPFNSNRSYNVLFAEQNGTRSAAQIKAFEDSWIWNQETLSFYQDVIEHGGAVSNILHGFYTFLGTSDMMAYLAMMAPRLLELQRVLKPDGSIYLHCDPTATHYLKLLMDAIFDPRNFRNEIIWKRTDAKGNVMKKFGWINDRILFYTKSDEWTWNQQFIPYDETYIRDFYKKVDSIGRRYQATDLTAPMSRASRGQIYTWKDYTPPPSRCFVYNKEKMEQLDKEGKIEYTRKGCPRLIRYLDEMEGNKCPDIWSDIKIAQKTERLGYPTQKPESLLERIIRTSSNEGETILDPFCGCGTTITVAHRLNRRWLGIDITHLSISLIKHRLKSSFGDDIKYKVIGEPTDLEGAKALAEQDKFQFQFWAIGLLEGKVIDRKRGPDKGIDGRINFFERPDDPKSLKQIIISVKGGSTGVKDIRDLRGVIEREKAAIGVFITLKESTRDMRKEATVAGFYESEELDESTETMRKRYPRIQILTIKELLDGKKIECPKYATRGGSITLKKALKSKIEKKSYQKQKTLKEN